MFKKKNNIDDRDFKSLDTIKEYLRSTNEFGLAYMRLKDLYRKYYNFACDSLDLVYDYRTDEIVYCDLGPIFVRLNDDFALVALDNCRMVITSYETDLEEYV